MRHIGELDMITRLIKVLESQGMPGSVNQDDCAVVHSGGELDWLLTSDPVIRGIHFTDHDAPFSVGHKAVGRVLSDIAAMGGDPRWMLVNVTALPDTEASWLENAYAGAAQSATRFETTIVGGDVARGSDLALHVFGVGSVPHGKALMRSGARDADVCFVTGHLGGSHKEHHLTFTPRIREGLWLRGRATAMIDISDGLATDLGHLVAASNVSARIDRDALPLSDAAVAGDRSRLEHALYDGEDFELLFTAPADQAADLIREWGQAFDIPCTPVGTIDTNASGIVLCGPGDQEAPLAPGGYQHFVTP